LSERGGQGVRTLWGKAVSPDASPGSSIKAGGIGAGLEAASKLLSRLRRLSKAKEEKEKPEGRQGPGLGGAPPQGVCAGPLEILSQGLVTLQAPVARPMAARKDTQTNLD